LKLRIYSRILAKFEIVISDWTDRWYNEPVEYKEFGHLQFAVVS